MNVTGIKQRKVTDGVGNNVISVGKRVVVWNPRNVNRPTGERNRQRNGNRNVGKYRPTQGTPESVSTGTGPTT